MSRQQSAVEERSLIMTICDYCGDVIKKADTLQVTLSPYSDVRGRLDEIRFHESCYRQVIDWLAQQRDTANDWEVQNDG